MVLTAEKVVQHTVVTLGFVTDIGDLRQEVAVDYRWLAFGAVVGLVFPIALVASIARRHWSLTLLSALAAVDIVGEFVAQGALIIKIKVSFVVAVAIFVLSRNAARPARTTN